MLEMLRQKFYYDRELYESLLATGDAPLIEGNDWGDTFWGQVNGQGSNMLGVMLMLVREEVAANSDEVKSNAVANLDEAESGTIPYRYLWEPPF